MRVKEVADLVGISVRTLHHYHEIGLLVPETITDSGYRLYSDHNLEMLQQILFFRELGFPLKKIKEIIGSPSFDQQEALAIHYKMLVEKRERLDKMINTVRRTIQHVKGEIEMTNKENSLALTLAKIHMKKKHVKDGVMKRLIKQIKLQRDSLKLIKNNSTKFTVI